MSTSTSPRRGSPSPAQSAGLAVVIVLVLLGLGQCGSGTENSSPTRSVETSDTAPPASESVAEEPVTLPPGPAPTSAFESLPIPDSPPLPELAPTPEPAPVPDYGDDDGSGGAAYYKNCSAARAAGAAPLYAGEPGYSSDLDGDGDGVACE